MKRVVFLVSICMMSLIDHCIASEALDKFKTVKDEIFILSQSCAYKAQIAFRSLQIAGETPAVMEKVKESNSCDWWLRHKIELAADSLKSEFSSDQYKVGAIRDWYVSYNEGIDAMSRHPLSADSLAKDLAGLSDTLVRKLEF